MKSTKNRDRNITHFLYVLPNLIMYSFLSIVPIVLGKLSLSFQLERHR